MYVIIFNFISKRSFFEDGVLNVHRLTANVTILPETLMGDPLYGNESTSLSKFRYNAGMQPKLRTMCSATLAWPRFVYDMYDTQAIIVRIKSFLSAMQISKSRRRGRRARFVWR